MTATLAFSVFVAVILTAAVLKGSAVQFGPPSCEFTCADASEFEEPLPREPDLAEGNRATQWGVVMLNQIRDNLKDLSPPGVARCLGIFSTCLHDAMAIETASLNAAVNGRPGADSIAVAAEVEDADDPTFTFVIGNDPTKFVEESAIDGAAYAALKAMFKGKESFAKVENFMLEVVGLDTASDDVGKGFKMQLFKSLDEHEAESFKLGQMVCKEVISEFKKDGFNVLGSPGKGLVPDYTPVNDPQTMPGITECDAEMTSMDHWQPLCVPVEFGSDECNVQKFLGPLAGNMTTFGITSGDSVSPQVGPPLIEDGEEAEWRKQAEQVIEFSAALTDVTKLIAEHWADGPDSTFPPGHWFRIGMEAAVNQGLSLVDSVRVMFLVGNALNDAGVGAWAAKVKHDSVRPLQMIQCGYAGETIDSWVSPYMGIGKIDASLWQPYQATTFVTPPFAGFVSGHSTFSAAAAGALQKFFGPEFVAPKCKRIEEGSSLFEGRKSKGEKGFIEGLTDIPNQGPMTKGYVPAEDVVLCWDTWEAAAEDAGISRLHGGIHILADHIEGKAMGNEIAAQVYQKAMQLWS